MLDMILIVAFGSVILAYFIGKISHTLRNTFAVLASLALVVFIGGLYRIPQQLTYFGFFEFPLILRINNLSWLFAISIASLTTLSIIFSFAYMQGKKQTNFYYAMLLLVNAGMLGVVLSGDLISFYVFWEIMSWSTFLLISYKRGPAIAAGMKYIIMSVAGSLAMLVGVLYIYSYQNTLILSELAVHLKTASAGQMSFILILFSIAFGIKNAIIPFHPWLPPAHSEAPSPFSAILSGILIKMGTYGFLLFLYSIVGLNALLGLSGYRITLNILAAITILIPTFFALLQDDAKRLLAWSTVAQAGYIIMGIAFGTSLSVTGGLFHFLNHAIFKALLFLAIGAVEYRTKGVRDLNSLGGLVKKMPVTFFAVLIGACGLIGVPLTNGFISKWIIYKTLILDGAPFLAFAALFGTWGTILYSYKLLHNIFLGQLPEKYKGLKQAPPSMQLPMILLAIAVLLFGILPGIPLACINGIMNSFGFETLKINLWGIISETGALNIINIFFAVLIVSILVGLLLKAARKSIAVSQEDTYAAGAAIPKEKYHYTVNFYGPLSRMLKPYCRDLLDTFYLILADWVQKLGDNIRRIYTGYVGNYVMYIVLFLAILIFIQLKWSPW